LTLPCRRLAAFDLPKRRRPWHRKGASPTLDFGPYMIDGSVTVILHDLVKRVPADRVGSRLADLGNKKPGTVW
jgi:hypothetical protein